MLGIPCDLGVRGKASGRGLDGRLGEQRCLSPRRGSEDGDQMQRKEQVMLLILNMLEPGESPSVHI